MTMSQLDKSEVGLAFNTRMKERMRERWAVLPWPESRYILTLRSYAKFDHDNDIYLRTNVGVPDRYFNCGSIVNPYKSRHPTRIMRGDANFKSILQDAIEEVTQQFGLRKFAARSSIAHCTIHFYCTKGVHRSPFCADQVARYFKRTEPTLGIRVYHMSRGDWYVIAPSKSPRRRGLNLSHKNQEAGSE